MKNRFVIVILISLFFMPLSTFASSRVIIFNDSSIVTGTGAIEIEIDGKFIGKLKRKQYLIVHFEDGKYKMALRHKEFFLPKYYEDIYTVYINSETYFKVFTGFTSTKVENVDKLPAFFEKKFEKIK